LDLVAGLVATAIGSDELDADFSGIRLSGTAGDGRGLVVLETSKTLRVDGEFLLGRSHNEWI